MNTKDDALIDEVRTSLSKATPAPWGALQSVDTDDIDSWFLLGELPWKPQDVGTIRASNDDVMLIAQAPSWLGALCSRVQELNEELDAIKESNAALNLELEEVRGRSRKYFDDYEDLIVSYKAYKKLVANGLRDIDGTISQIRG